MKKFLKKIGRNRWNRYLRYIRSFYFELFDLIGEGVFGFLRILRAIKPILPFEKNSVKKILVIRLDRIGDLILSTPVFKALRGGFPQAKIYLLVQSYTLDLVINNSNLDGVLVLGKDKIPGDFDLAIALHPGYKQNQIAFQSGARFRIGYTGSGGGFFLTRKVKDDRQIRIRHEVVSGLELAKIAGCSIEVIKPEVSFTEKGELFGQDFFERNGLFGKYPIVAIHPGARQEYIRWNSSGFAEVASRLMQEFGSQVILIGSGNEKLIIEEIVSLMPIKPIISLDLALTELVSLIKRCSLFIGNSSGPMHIAAALDVPVVGIFGNIHPLDSYQEWGPWGNKHLVVSVNLKCKDCHPGDCRDFQCMKLITPEMVFAAVKKQIKA